MHHENGSNAPNLPGERGADAALARVLDRWGIGVTPRPADVGHLETLHSAWLANVPFENVTKLLRASGSSAMKRGRLPDEFWSDHLEWGSGGTCFDVTAAFRALLMARGFDARVIFCRVPERPGRSHVALLVNVDGRTLLADAGFALPAPVPLPKRGIVRRHTPFYDIEVRCGVGKEYLLFTEDDRGSRFRYAFDSAAVSEREFQAASAATFHPAAPFMNRLALGKFRNGSRYIYKGPSSLHILSRTEQRVEELPSTRTRRLSNIFGVRESLLQRGAALLGP